MFHQLLVHYKTTDDNVLINTITQLALLGSSADPHYWTEVINTCKTLNDLTEKLQTIGFALKRSLVYLRLIPRRKDKTEGKHHKKVANVKLQDSIYGEEEESQLLLRCSHNEARRRISCFDGKKQCGYNR